MMSYLVSIIIPVYNLENYISTCLESILKQSYSNLQIIVINDGSTDGSLKVLNEFAIKDSRVEIVNKCNEGVSIARNTGIQISKGDYIMFVDGDDYIEYNMVETLLSACTNHKADYVGAGFVFEDPKAGRKRHSQYGFGLIEYVGEEIFSQYLSGHYIWSSVWGCMIKSTLIKNNNILFDCKLAYDEDCYFIMQIMSKAQKVIVKDTHLYHVSVRPTSVTRKTLHELDKNKKRPDYEIYLKNNGYWEIYNKHCKAWLVRSANHELFHLALRVGYNDYKNFFTDFSKKHNYLLWNNRDVRSVMNKRNCILSILGKYPFLSWCVLNLPRLFGKHILI